jgi:hypothetical protein
MLLFLPPFSSDSTNIQRSKDIKAEQKATRRPSPTMNEITNMQSTLSSQIDSKFNDLNSTMNNMADRIVEAIKTQPSGTSQDPSPLGVNWATIIQGLISG